MPISLNYLQGRDLRASECRYDAGDLVAGVLRGPRNNHTSAAHDQRPKAYRGKEVCLGTGGQHVIFKLNFMTYIVLIVENPSIHLSELKEGYHWLHDKGVRRAPDTYNGTLIH